MRTQLGLFHDQGGGAVRGAGTEVWRLDHNLASASASQVGTATGPLVENPPYPAREAGAPPAPAAPGTSPALAKDARRRRAPRWRQLKWLAVLAAFGPGLMVMLADTDAGSVVTAAQSGARWGYALLPLELLLIPVLYLVMELTVRLGIATRKGHAQLIKERFGRGWAGIAVGALLISTTGALTTEFAGLAGVGSMVGLSPDLVIPAGAAFLGLVVMSGSYRRVERIGVALGLFELAFIVAAVRAHPAISGIAGSIWAREPLGNSGYLSLVAANVGAVVMPWMIFYQQAAVVDKGLAPRT